MTDILLQAKDLLLTPAGIDFNDLEQVFQHLQGRAIDAADLYFQSVHHESWILEDSIVKEAAYETERGVGVRAVSGEKTGFAYSDDIVLPALDEAILAARSIVKQGSNLQIPIKHPLIVPKQYYPPINPLASLSEQDKVALLHTIDTEARRLDPRIKHVVTSLAGVYEVILIMRLDGQIAADIRPLVRLNVQVIAEHQDKRSSGYMGGGGRGDYLQYATAERGLAYAREAVRQAVLNLDAIDAPAGEMPVVLGPGWPGVLLHEAIGHGLEGDFNRKGTSAFSGRIGERVAAPLCTIVDDGTLPGRRGSLNIDDEGTPTQCTTLIENGILKNYLQDNLNARLMNMQSTGNGRRESYADLPLPRMTNTYMLPGPYDPSEIIASVPYGIYAVNFGGGQVDITSGKFVFSASEAYLIENGKITRPVKGATLIGNGPDILTHVSMVGNDLELDHGVGVCGKEGQSVPVGVGQPTLKIDKLTVGGTSI